MAINSKEKGKSYDLPFIIIQISLYLLFCTTYVSMLGVNSSGRKFTGFRLWSERTIVFYADKVMSLNSQ